VLKRRTRARAHALVGWLSGRLDLSVRPCGRARGVAGVGVVYQSTSLPFANVADIPRLRLREARPLSGVDYAYYVVSTKAIGHYFEHSAHYTPSFHIYGHSIEIKKTISISIIFRRDLNERARLYSFIS
jgi:hypothetical protein